MLEQNDPKLYGDILKNLIEEYKTTGILNGDSSKTQKSKRESLNRLLAWLGDRELTIQTANAYLLHLKHDRHYKLNAFATENTRIHAFSNWLFEREYIPKSWKKLLPKIKTETRSDDVYLDPLLVRSIIFAGTKVTPYVRRGEPGDNALNVYRKGEMKKGLLFQLAHGLRFGELLRLTGSDLNLHDTPEATFSIAPSKGHGRVRHPLSPELIPLVQDRINRERLFEVTEKTSNLALKRGCQKLGIKTQLTTHILRHIYISNLAKNKVHPTDIQRLARHKSFDVTVRNYIHLDISELALAQSTASPTARAYLPFKDKMGFVEKMLESLHLDLAGVEIQWLNKTDREMTMRLVNKNTQ